MEGTKIVHYNILTNRVLDKIYTNTYYIGDSRKTAQGLEEVSAMLQASSDDRDILLDNIRQATTHVTATLSRLIGRTRCTEETILDTDDPQYIGTIDSLDTAKKRREKGEWADISSPFTLSAKYSDSGKDLSLNTGDTIIATGYETGMQTNPGIGDLDTEIKPQAISGDNLQDVNTGGTIWKLFPDYPKTGKFQFTILATKNMPVEAFKEIAALSEDFIAAFAIREWALSVKPDEASVFETRIQELEARLRILGSIRQKPARKSIYGGLRPQDIIIEE